MYYITFLYIHYLENSLHLLLDRPESAISNYQWKVLIIDRFSSAVELFKMFFIIYVDSLKLVHTLSGKIPPRCDNIVSG